MKLKISPGSPLLPRISVFEDNAALQVLPEYITKINVVYGDNDPLCYFLSFQSVFASCFAKLSSVVHRNTECSVRSQKNKQTTQNRRQGGMPDKEEGEGEQTGEPVNYYTNY